MNDIFNVKYIKVSDVQLAQNMRISIQIEQCNH